MAWPPHSPRKYPDLTPQEARVKALVPHQWQRGQSGSPGGLSKPRKEQLAAINQAALERTPEALETLTELMRHSSDDRVRTRCAEIIIERGLGKPREAPPPEAVEEMLQERVKVEISFVPAEPSTPIIDATAAAVSDPEPAHDAGAQAPPDPASPARPYFTPEQIQRLETEVARICGEIERLRRAAEEDEFSGRE